MLSIPLTGLAANDPVPGNYLEINFAQGPASLGTAVYGALFIGNRTTAGNAVVDTTIYGPYPGSPLPMATNQDIINLFGQGSELHRMWLRFQKINSIIPVYAIAAAESGGAAATLAITFATTATANGTVRLYMGDDFVDATITQGDIAIVIAGNVANAINSKLDWAVTAANGGTAICTLTAKNKGLRGNWLRGAAVVLGTGVGTTSNVTAQTFFTGGTTADSNTNALATIIATRFYYIVSAAEDATQFGAAASQVDTQASPVTGIRQRVFGASVDTLGNITTIATGINRARTEVTWLQNADWTPAELAANAAGVYSLKEAPLRFLKNFSGFGNDTNTQPYWKVPAPRSGTVPTRASIKSALNNGITPIGVNPNGTTYLVKRITTRSLSGANSDYRIRDAHKVTVCDRYGDDLLNKYGLQFSGKDLIDDPVPGQRIPGPTVTWPKAVKAAVNKLTDDYDGLDMLQNVQAIKDGTLAIRQPSPTTQVGVKIPLTPIDILDSIATSIDQVG